MRNFARACSGGGSPRRLAAAAKWAGGVPAASPEALGAAHRAATIDRQCQSGCTRLAAGTRPGHRFLNAACAATTYLVLANSPMLASDAPAALPPGHPAIATQPATAPASAIGTLHIRGIPRSNLAPIPAGDKAMVHLFQGEKLLKRAEGMLDAKGQLEVGDISLTPAPITAMVMIQHGPVTYQTVAEDITSATPNMPIDVAIYETTKDKPAWKIPMRHLMLSRTDAGIRVVDLLVADNPGDRTWIGNADTDEGDGLATLMLRLPDTGGNLELGDNLSQQNVHFHGQTLVNVAPMVPGITRYELAYTLPVVDGKVTLPITAPADTQQVVVMLPDDGSQVQAQGLTPGSTSKTEDGASMRMYQTAAVPIGQTVSVSLTGIPDANGAVTSGGLSGVQIAGIAGLGVVLLGGLAIMFLKKPAPKPNK